MDAAHRIVARTFRQEADRILASLISSVKDFELAQDALQDALLDLLARAVGHVQCRAGWHLEADRQRAVVGVREELRRKHTGGDQQERACPVGALGVARGQAPLGQQRGLLVHGDPGDRQRAPERGRLASYPGAVRHLR